MYFMLQGKCNKLFSFYFACASDASESRFKSETKWNAINSSKLEQKRLICNQI